MDMLKKNYSIYDIIMIKYLNDVFYTEALLRIIVLKNDSLLFEN